MVFRQHAPPPRTTKPSSSTFIESSSFATDIENVREEADEVLELYATRNTDMKGYAYVCAKCDKPARDYYDFRVHAFSHIGRTSPGLASRIAKMSMRGMVPFDGSLSPDDRKCVICQKVVHLKHCIRHFFTTHLTSKKAGPGPAKKTSSQF